MIDATRPEYLQAMQQAICHIGSTSPAQLHWWSMLAVDPEFMNGWRESVVPGGCAHACELETSLYLHLDEENVKKDQIRNGYIEFHKDQSRFNWVDLFAAGAATKISWTASYSDTGVLGEAELASKEIG